MGVVTFALQVGRRIFVMVVEVITTSGILTKTHPHTHEGHYHNTHITQLSPTHLTATSYIHTHVHTCTTSWLEPLIW